MITYADRPKRALDIVGAGALLLVTSPLMCVITVAVRVKLGSPVIFRQMRTGHRERDFQMLKFRTMTDARDSRGELLPDAQRITQFGAKLRQSSLDELPELFNVLRGEMSLVGPRPLPTRYTQHFTDDERRRFDVRPGITGLAQVSGRNDTPWSERFAADVEYVRSRSLNLDLQIMWRTLIVALRRDGLHVDPGKHMDNFDVERAQAATCANEDKAIDGHDDH